MTAENDEKSDAYNSDSAIDWLFELVGENYEFGELGFKGPLP